MRYPLSDRKLRRGRLRRRFKNMNIFGHARESARPRLGKPMLVSLLSLALSVHDLASESARLSTGPARAGAGHSAGASAEWASPSAIRYADSRTNPTVSSADCAVPGLTRRAGPGSRHVSRTSGGGRPMGASASRFEGRRVGSSRRSTTLGPERQGAHCISIRPGKYGQEPVLDLISRRRLLQPATGRDGCRAGNAPASATIGKS